LKFKKTAFLETAPDRCGFFPPPSITRNRSEKNQFPSAVPF